MYQRDQVAIAQWAKRAPENTARVCQFAMVSAHMKFFNVGATMDDLSHGIETTTAVKARAFSELWDDRDAIFYNVRDIVAMHADDDQARADYLVTYLAQLPGLGVIKAGFVACMLDGVSACVDTHNVKAFGIDADFTSSAWRIKRAVTNRQRARIARRYNDLVARLGGAETLWDQWCHAMATRYPEAYRSADHVSRLHPETIGV